MNQHWTLQAFRFAGVGGVATLIHVMAAYLAVLVSAISPFGANLIGFLCAIGFSYFGNSYWTFGGRTDHAASVTRFAISAFLCFLLSNGIVFAVTTLMQWRFEIALVIIVLLIPPLSFCLARFWAFRSRSGREGEAPNKSLRT